MLLEYIRKERKAMNDFEVMQRIFSKLDNEITVTERTKFDNSLIEVVSGDYPDESIVFLFDKKGNLVGAE